MREAQLVWPELQPFVGDRATSAARNLELRTLDAAICL